MLPFAEHLFLLIHPSPPTPLFLLPFSIPAKGWIRRHDHYTEWRIALEIPSQILRQYVRLSTQFRSQHSHRPVPLVLVQSSALWPCRRRSAINSVTLLTKRTSILSFIHPVLLCLSCPPAKWACNPFCTSTSTHRPPLTDTVRRIMMWGNVGCISTRIRIISHPASHLTWATRRRQPESQFSLLLRFRPFFDVLQRSSSSDVIQTHMSIHTVSSKWSYFFYHTLQGRYFRSASSSVVSFLHHHHRPNNHGICSSSGADYQDFRFTTMPGWIWLSWSMSRVGGWSRNRELHWFI